MSIGVLVGSSAVSAGLMGSGEVTRQITGSWLDQFINSKNPNARAAIDGGKGFRPLASMMLYMTGFGKNNNDPEAKNNFEKRLKRLEKAYTNYGCYCWINGVDEGVTGGGRVKDVSDHHCKELYRCYKCVNIDYSKNYTDVSYTVDFTTDGNGNRQLDCSANSKQDAENICECDKRFAENIAITEQSCAAGDAADEMYGNHCQDESFRTGNGGGSFDPKNQCDKQFHGHDKDRCCGIYPNRYPYDENHKDCCKTTAVDGDANAVDIFSLMPADGRCEDSGGEVVVSVDGDPHQYINANKAN